jgi:hypothetical protein
MVGSCDGEGNQHLRTLNKEVFNELKSNNDQSPHQHCGTKSTGFARDPEHIIGAVEGTGKFRVSSCRVCLVDELTSKVMHALAAVCCFQMK